MPKIRNKILFFSGAMLLTLVVSGCRPSFSTKDSGSARVPGAESRVAAVTVSDQPIQDAIISVDQVIADAQSWIVIHADDNGQPGKILGYALVKAGVNDDVLVEIKQAEATDKLYAMLHTDQGERSNFEFPNGADVPVTRNGRIVMASFQIETDDGTTPDDPTQDDDRVLEDDNDSTAEDDEITEDGDGSAAEDAQTFDITGRNFSFSQTEIRVKQGDKVKINFSSVGGLHNWVVDEFNVQTQQVNTGESSSVEFTADKAGTFEYYCSIGSHRQMGMVGKLIVE